MTVADLIYSVKSLRFFVKMVKNRRKKKGSRDLIGIRTTFSNKNIIYKGCVLKM